MEFPEVAKNHPQRIYLFQNHLMNQSFRLRGPTYCCHMAKDPFEHAREQQVLFGELNCRLVPHNERHFVNATSLEQLKKNSPSRKQPL